MDYVKRMVIQLQEITQISFMDRADQQGLNMKVVSESKIQSVYGVISIEDIQ